MKKILWILLTVSGFIACTNETENNPEEKDVVYIDIVPVVAGSIQSEVTRAMVDGAFDSDSRIGLSIASTSSATSMHQMYTNFYSLFNGTSWGYYLNNTYNGTLLSGFASWGKISVMGYYPYNNNVTDVSAIPFSIADVTPPGIAETTEDRATVDYMVAKTKTKDMAVPSGALSLEFDHLMTSITFYVRRSYQGPQIKLSKVKFEIDGNRYFDIAGTYNAKNPNMTDLSSNLNVSDRVQTLEVNYTGSDKTFTYNTTYREALLLMFPQLKQIETDLSDDATVTLTFYFTDAFGSSYIFDDQNNAFDGQGNPQMSFKLSSILNDGKPNGFLAGWNYRIAASIGTYIRFEGAPYVVYKPLIDSTDPEYIEI